VDAQSAMLACEKTWIRPMNQIEQKISKQLYNLAACGFNITVGFVFSHLGVAGNRKVDIEADKARKNIGDRISKYGYQCYDTIRVFKNQLHCKFLLFLKNNVEEKFRFKTMIQNNFFKLENNNGRFANQVMSKIMSPHLPRLTMIKREDEIRLYYARLGMFPEIGGYYHQEEKEPCPLCGEDEAIGRNGLTITHLFRTCNELDECRKDKSGKNIDLILLLWENPIFSIFLLRFVSYLYLFYLKNPKNIINIHQRSENKQKFVPFILSFLQQEIQKNTRPEQRNIVLRVSDFVRSTFLHSTMQDLTW
jgi:hypothetical protein